MSTVNNHRVVVRRKKSGGKGGHHGGSWKIAYADFITAMMAFFLVMWLISIVPREELKGIAEYFRMPLSVAIAGGPSSSAETSAIPGGGSDPLRDQGETRRSNGNRVQSQNIPDSERRDRHRLERLKQRLDSLIETSPVLKNFKPQLLIDMTTEGLRIQIIDSQNRPMFATGSAEVRPYMRDILRELGPTLNELPNKISISGHTDASQYARGERAYSNWELSADRANSSRQELVAGGMNETKVLRIQGLSSSMSLVKDDPYAAVNRRISLVVLNEKTQKRIEDENAAAAEVSARDAQDVMHAVQERAAAAAAAPASGIVIPVITPATPPAGTQPAQAPAGQAAPAAAAATVTVTTVSGTSAR